MKRNRSQGKVFFFVIFGLLALAMLVLMQPFFSIIAISVVVVILLKPVFNWFIARKWVRGHRGLATTLSLLAFFLILVIPIAIVGNALVNQAQNLVESVSTGELDTSMDSLVEKVNSFFDTIPSLSDIEISPEQLAQILKGLASAVLSWLTNLAVSIGATLPSLIIGLFVFLILAATLLSSSDTITNLINELSPLDTKITHLYGQKALAMTKSMITGVFLMAIIEGAIMGVFYWLAGVPFVMLWTFLSMLFGILPVVGISFIVLPMSIILILNGNITSALIVLFGFYVVVNPMDLWLRPRLVSKEAATNFVLLLLAMMGGIYIGGFLGLIYGPVIMILFVTTIQIYRDHFSEKDETEQGGEPEDETGGEINSAPPAGDAHDLIQAETK